MSSLRQDCLDELSVNAKRYHYSSFIALERTWGVSFRETLPYCLKILLENLLRHEDGETVSGDDIEACVHWPASRLGGHEIAYRPARVLMQDFTGVPAIVDLSAMRDAILQLGGSPHQINPFSPVDLIIDHSIQVDAFGHAQALHQNTKREMERNQERYAFLRWGEKNFSNFRVVPPEKGICHQINMEYLAKPIRFDEKEGQCIAYPDTLVGTDSHTTMVNALGVLGWGVGGIEAEAAMLGQPISLCIPEVIGVYLSGALREGVTATDLVLTLTELLRKKGVVSKFVEYIGSGLGSLSVADRATIANMAPEYGATCGFFPIDQATLDYLCMTGRSEEEVKLVEHYAKVQSLWYEPLISATPTYTEMIEFDLSSVSPSLAGPRRPQDRVSFHALPDTFDRLLVDEGRESERGSIRRITSLAPESALESSLPLSSSAASVSVSPSSASLNQQQTHIHVRHGDVVIAAITSCTNTSNPDVLIAAGLLAKKAVQKGLSAKPWVKTSLAPGSLVVTKYLHESGLQVFLDQLGFNLVGYGCTTCIGNSGPLPPLIAQKIMEDDLIVCAVLSGNRNFAGRIHPAVKANWLASPPLVVAFALAGTINIDLSKDALAYDAAGQPVYLNDLWPTTEEIMAVVSTIQRDWFQEQYATVFKGPAVWNALAVPQGDTYAWQVDSTYIQCPPFFATLRTQLDPIQSIEGARILALLGDSITTDHISPAGAIKENSPAGHYLREKGVSIADFNSYGARRGNHEVMMRGTFANIRLCNEMVAPKEGGFTKHYPSEEIIPIYDAAMRYQNDHIPLVIIAGKEYGTGSSRDWAAKGPKLLGVRAVIAESFERIHRSNLIGMGILPLQFPEGVDRHTLQLTGSETIEIKLNAEVLSTPHAKISVVIKIMHSGTQKSVVVDCLSRIDTKNEMKYYQHGGILNYVLRNIVRK